MQRKALKGRNHQHWATPDAKGRNHQHWATPDAKGRNHQHWATPDAKKWKHAWSTPLHQKYFPNLPKPMQLRFTPIVFSQQC